MSIDEDAYTLWYKQLSAPHDWNALEAKWMGVGRVGQSAIYRRIGKSLVHQYDGWWLKHLRYIVCAI